MDGWIGCRSQIGDKQSHVERRLPADCDSTRSTHTRHATCTREGTRNGTLRHVLFANRGHCSQITSCTSRLAVVPINTGAVEGACPAVLSVGRWVGWADALFHLQLLSCDERAVPCLTIAVDCLLAGVALACTFNVHKACPSLADVLVTAS